jgi:2-methylcitrate dehydratase PrpD
MTVIETLADWLVGLRWEDIPESVRERARWQVVNVIASMLAGAENEDALAVRRAVAGWGKTGGCTVIPTGERLPLHEALLVGGAYSIALDYDDYVAMGHTGHSAVLPSLAIAERDGRSLRHALVAQVAANEIGGRLGASVVLGPQNGQSWSFLHCIEAAAVAAKMGGLDANRTAHALAISLYQPPFTLWPGFMGPGSKVLTAAAPMAQGVMAADFAREGMTGALDIIEHPRKGFWASFAWAPIPQRMEGLGERWITETIAYKKHPGCAYIGTTMDALFAACAEGNVRAGDIERVDVAANLLTVEMTNISAPHLQPGAPLSPIHINFSIPYSVAVGLAGGRLGSRELSRAFLDAHDAEIRSLAGRVGLSHDWEMSLMVLAAFGGGADLKTLSPAAAARALLGYVGMMGGEKEHRIALAPLVGAWRKRRPPPGPIAFPAKVTITTKDGRRFAARRDVPEGAPGAPRLFETVEEKLRVEAEGRLPPGRADALLAAARRYEQAAAAEVIRSAVAAR